MADSYPSAQALLEDALGLVALLFEREIHEQWERGTLPRIHDEFSGTFVSGDEVTAIFGRGDAATTPEGQAHIASLDRTIAELDRTIEERLAHNRRLGAALPFDSLRAALHLSRSEQRALWVLIAVEVSSRLRALMRYLVNEAGRVYADIGLLELMVYRHGSARPNMIRELAPDGRLMSLRLIEPVGGPRRYEEAPYLLRSLRVNPRVIELAMGYTRLDPEIAGVAHLVVDPPKGDHLLMPAEVVAQVHGLLGPSLGPGQNPVVVLAGAEGTGRKALAMDASNRAGRPVLHIFGRELADLDPSTLSRLARALAREATLFGAMPLIEDIDLLGPDSETGRPDRLRPIDAALAGFEGPIAATCGPRDTRPATISRSLLMIELALPPEADRALLWRRQLGNAAAGDLDIDAIAARYPVSAGILERSASSARKLAEARGPDSAITDADIHAGLRSALDIKLSGHGRRVQWRQTWDDLILPEDSQEEIREFIARVKHRRQVYDEWGFSRKMAKGLGLSALFAGQPGTGKTMVAGLIASELALDLYQIDLSRIVSKYVGETEKNLAELFDAAEAGHAILLFDEADSLFAKRTEVKSSVDRYANLEVNYLLQRMEGFGGITILTTNMDSAIDEAFRRRISFKVNFPFPEPEDRKKLWRVMLPEQAAVSGDIDYDLLSDRYEMSGGYIRNAVLRAAFLAAEDESPITMRHMMRAANLEYTAMGKVISHL